MLKLRLPSLLHAGVVPACAAALIGLASMALAQPATQPATKPAIAKPVQNEDLPKPDAIIKQCVEAMGGQKRFDAIKSMDLVASISTPMGPMGMEIKSMRENGAMLIRNTMGGQDMMTMGFDGTVGWMNATMMGAGYQLMEEDEIEEMKNQASMQDMVGMMKKQYKDMATVDVVTFNEKECFKIGMVPKDDEAAGIHYAMFDRESGLLMGVEMTENDPQMGPMTVTMTMNEWQMVDELKFPKRMTISQGPMPIELVFERIELNKLDAAVFELPDEVKKMVDEKQPATQPAP